MSHTKVLIVEDEILIADTIARYLKAKEFQTADIAISFDEAVELIANETIDIAILDIRLNGKKTGIDLAKHISNLPNPFPYIYLTSQSDKRSLEAAKNTFPAGYLTKPIQKESLYTTLEIALYNHSSGKDVNHTISINDGLRLYNLSPDTICFIQADHVYCTIHLEDGKLISVRRSLKQLLDILPSKTFVQVHRSYLVNINKVEQKDSSQITIAQQNIPISRSKRKHLEDMLS